jgi:hypothetical protein
MASYLIKENNITQGPLGAKVNKHAIKGESLLEYSTV